MPLSGMRKSTSLSTRFEQQLSWVLAAYTLGAEYSHTSITAISEWYWPNTLYILQQCSELQLGVYVVCVPGRAALCLMKALSGGCILGLSEATSLSMHAAVTQDGSSRMMQASGWRR